MIDQETTIKLANEAGIEFQQHQGVSGKVSVTTCGSQRVERMQAFAQAAYLRGLEDAAKLAEAQQDLAEQEKADKRFKDAIKEGDERNAVDRGEHWMCVTTCNAVLRNAAKAIRSLKEQQHG